MQAIFEILLGLCNRFVINSRDLPRHEIFMRGQVARTIYAQSTAPGKAAIGIIRVSGPGTLGVIAKLTRRNTAPPSHKARVTNLYSDRGLLDQALMLYFEKPNSYTGEDVAELHCHGSGPVLAAVMQALSDAGCKHAEPGEFTKRAFHSGRLDLTSVEGIRDLLNAETELQRQLAVSGAMGGLAKIYDTWRKDIINNTAMLTALIDFADDNEIESTPHSLISTVHANIERLHRQVHTHASRIKQTELISEGVRMAVIGEPNAGKSSLVNRLVNRAASIVSDVPGTTRDIVQVNLDIGGYKVVIGDTAGLRDVPESSQGHDQLEKIGIERAREAIATSHILLVVQPLDKPLSPLIKQEIELAKQNNVRTVIVGNKLDLVSAPKGFDSSAAAHVSSKTGEGFEQLIDRIAAECADLSGTTTTSEMVGASQRTRELLRYQVLPGLEQALFQLQKGDVILASAELDLAVDGIAKITGKSIGINEVLDVVFGTFCIGK